MSASVFFMQIDPSGTASAASAWNPLTPVLLPVGPLTTGSILSASMGVFIPFLIFLVAFFNYLYSLWHSNSLVDAKGAGAPMNKMYYAASGSDYAYGNDNEGMCVRASVASSSFLQPPRPMYGNNNTSTITDTSRAFFSSQ